MPDQDNQLLLVFIGILSSVGALRILPMILEDCLQVLKKCLEVFSEFLNWYRLWRIGISRNAIPANLNVDKSSG